MWITREALTHKKFFTQIFIILLYLYTGIAAASNTVKFYVSNNSSQLDLAQALNRFLGPEQSNLQDNVIDSLQTTHMQQARMHSVLGAYKNFKQQVSIDNSLVIVTSPYQELNEQEIVHFASELAKKFRQETVGVFIPDSKSSGLDVVLTYKSNVPEVSDSIGMLQDKLPKSYT